jgi:cell division protein FtsI/penicillin-binding protein 2
VPLEQQFPCSREWFGGQYGDSREFRTNWNTENEGIMNGQMAIVRSCNPYYWQMGVELEGFDPFLLPEYSRMMGLGVRTGIQGVQEETGRIPDPDYRSSQNQTWTIADTLNLVIGQGDSAVNPLQVARMIAVIANGGNLVTPYLVNEISLIGEEPSYVHEPQITPLDLDQQVLADVREAMCAVTANPSGTASFVYEAWYDFQNYAVIVCGKTGTAQSGGGTEPHAWFGAFAPSEDPQIAIAVVVENSCEGSEVASPIVRRIVEIYYGLPKSQWPPLWQSGCSEIVVQ